MDKEIRANCLVTAVSFTRKDPCTCCCSRPHLYILILDRTNPRSERRSTHCRTCYSSTVMVPDVILRSYLRPLAFISVLSGSLAVISRFVVRRHFFFGFLRTGTIGTLVCHQRAFHPSFVYTLQQNTVDMCLCYSGLRPIMLYRHFRRPTVAMPIRLNHVI